MLDHIKIIQTRSLVRWLPLVVLLLAAYWRIGNLGEQSFWNDEGNSLSLIQREPANLLEAVSLDIHPPAYYLILKFWANLAGLNEIGLRSLSAFWGLLAIAGTYALGARLFARAAGIVAALLVAMNPAAIYYSQEARMYAQLAALAVLSLYCLLRLLDRPSFAWAAGLMLVNTLGLYTHYTYPVTMLLQGILLVWAWKIAPVRVFVLLNLLSLLVFAPWLPTAYEQLSSWPADDTGIPLGEKLSSVVIYISYGNTASDLGWGEYLWLGLLFFAFVIPDWYFRPPSNRWRVALPLLWIVLLGGMVVFSGAYREANLKFLLPAQIGMALVLGRNAYLLWDMGSGSAALPLEMLPRYFAAITLGMVLLNTYTWQGLLSAPQFQRDDYRGLVAYIQNWGAESDAIILNAPGQLDVFSHYYKGAAKVYPLPRAWSQDEVALLAETQQIIANHRRIWVVFWGEGERDPQGLMKKTLDEKAYEIGSQWFGDVRLVQYAVLEAPASAPERLTNLQFGEHITLLGYARTDLDTGMMGVTLFWQTDALLETRYKIFVQILNAEGQLLAQHDSEPANNRAFTTDWRIGETVIDNHGLLIPLLSPGDYTMIVGVYVADDPRQRLNVAGDDFGILERIRIE